VKPVKQNKQEQLAMHLFHCETKKQIRIVNLLLAVDFGHVVFATFVHCESGQP